MRTHLNIPAYILFCVSIMLTQNGLCQYFNIRNIVNGNLLTHNMYVEVRNDSLIVFGTTEPTTPSPYWRPFYSIKNAAGDDLLTHIFYDDSVGLDMYITVGGPVARLHNGGYAVTGYVNVGERPFLMLLNPDFTIKKLTLLPDPEQSGGQTMLYYKGIQVIEEIGTDKNIYVGGNLQHSGSLTIVPFVAKIDSLGNPRFVKKYSTSGMFRFMDGFSFNGDNHIEISGYKSSKASFTGNSENAIGYHYGFIQRVDTAGNLLSYSEIGGGGCLFRTNASIHFDVAGYRYITYGQAIAGTYNPMYQRCAVDWVLQKTDASGDIVWERKLVDSSYSWVDYVDIGKILSDGDVLLFGTSKQYEHLPFYGQIGCQTLGRLVRISPQGEIRWDRYFYQPSDTCINFNSIFNFLYSTAEDAQGNIYAAGMSEDPNFAPQQQGWLLKMDADGCMLPNCNLGIENGNAGGIAGSVYPNPATDGFWYYTPEALPGKTEFTLYGLDGKVHRKHTAYTLPAGTYVRFEVSGLPPGMYALAVENSGKRAVYKILVNR